MTNLLLRVLIVLVILFPLTEARSGESKAETASSAADFQLQDLTGKTHNLSIYLEKGTVVLWFTNFCGGCQKAMPEIKEVFSENQVTLLIISLLGDDKVTPGKIIEKFALPFPALLDPEGKVCLEYAGTYVPKSCPLNNLFVIDQGGRVIRKEHYPGLEKSELKNLLKIK